MHLFFSLTRAIFTLAIITASALPIFSQGVGVGQWRVHLPFAQGRYVAETPNKVYCASESSLFSYTKSDGSVERLTKATGLSDVGIGSMAYHAPSNTLIIGYKNGNIDLVVGNQIINVSDIERNDIAGDKEIYNIHLNGPLAYLTTGFGIVVMNLVSRDIRDTYFLGPNDGFLRINDATSDAQNLYAATLEGVFFARLDDPLISKSIAWQKMEDAVLSDAPLEHITSFNGSIYASQSTGIFNGDTLFQHDGTGWSIVPTVLNLSINSLEAYPDELIIAHNGNVGIYNTQLQLLNSIFTFDGDGSVQPQQAIRGTESEVVWIADGNRGLMKSGENLQFNATVIAPQGPATANVTDMRYNGGFLWVAPGGRSDNWQPVFLRDGIFFFEGGQWAQISANNDPGLNNIADLITVAIDPSDGSHVFAGTMTNGLLEFRDGQLIEVYDDTNSSLTRSAANWIGVPGIAFDSENNLWMSNLRVPNALSVRKNNGEWEAYDFSDLFGTTEAGALLIDHVDQKWMISRDNGGGLLVFDESRNSSRLLNSNEGNGNLPSSVVNCMALDQDNEIWVGTNAGIAVFFSPEDVLSNSPSDASQILVSQDGFLGFLLETEVVNAIAIDGADRKWIGTESSGVFLMSADGTQQLLNFTTENSPLFSNAVRSLAIDDQTGEVFMGTTDGIISYKGTATAGDFQFGEVYAYPNPVRETYDGLIAIKGLVRNASVKITDIAGNLVFETQAEGGQAVWNGRSFDGDRVHTGVYLVFSSNEDGSETNVTKILFIQ